MHRNLLIYYEERIEVKPALDNSSYNYIVNIYI